MNDYPLGGQAFTEHDWAAAFDAAASLDSVNDQRRYAPWHDDAEHTDYQPLRDQRHPCQNALCDTLTEACFCSEACREQEEGPDHEVHDDAPVAAAPALGEAPCSVNVHVQLAGRDVQITLRGLDEGEVLQRLEQLLARYPAQASAPTQAPEKGWCPVHQVAMRLNEKAGRTWYSHKTAAGWCKGFVKRTGGPAHG